MKTMTTYSPNERITWRMVGGVMRAVEIERDRSTEAKPGPKPMTKPRIAPVGKYVSCLGCEGLKRREARLCHECTYRNGPRCSDCGERVKSGAGNRCRDCVQKSRELDMANVERVLGGEWRIPTSRADRLEVIGRWTGSMNELRKLTGWNVSRLVKQARPTEEVA